MPLFWFNLLFFSLCAIQLTVLQQYLSVFPQTTPHPRHLQPFILNLLDGEFNSSSQTHSMFLNHRRENKSWCTFYFMHRSRSDSHIGAFAAPHLLRSFDFHEGHCFLNQTCRVCAPPICDLDPPAASSDHLIVILSHTCLRH